MATSRKAVMGLALAFAIAASACYGKTPLKEGTVSRGGGGSSAAGGNPTGGAGGSIGADGGDGAKRAATLAPLATTDETIDQADGAALFDLARAIGYAHGYALCSCLGMGVFDTLTVEALDSCSHAESRFQALFEPMQARCILERSRDLPGFDAYLRCQIKELRRQGQIYAGCAMGKETRPDVSTANNCSASTDVAELLVGDICANAFYCADGTFVMYGRCDQVANCPDRADERGCGDFVCGDQLIYPHEACNPAVCPAVFTLSLCIPGDRERILCGDGTFATTSALCNGVNDCPNGKDEDAALCF